MPSEFFDKHEQQSIVEAIRLAEEETSGEIRVHIDKTCHEDVLDRASYWFGKLEMHKTELRNGVLFYLSTSDRKFAIIGDAGINTKVSSDFWDETKELIISHFKQGLYANGLVEGIKLCGQQLKVHFPYQSNDVNELPNEISFGKS
ncbi:MAG: TPM domain-containing protein [Breznakibacter sp.]